MAVKKKGLGRGIDSLIPDTSASGRNKNQGKETVREVIKEVKVPAETVLKLSEIEPNRDQPRKEFDENELKELAESIKQYGIIQPLVVRKRDDYYEIIAGERRWRAAKMAKLDEVPVVIKDYMPQEAMEIALIENIQRKDLNPLEEAMAYRSLIDEYHLTQEELAGRVSKSRSAITNSMRLLNLPKEVQKMLEDGEISTGHARALLSENDSKKQIEAARKIVEKGLSVRETEKLMEKPKGAKKPKKGKDSLAQEDLAYEELTERLREILGTNVAIRRKKEGSGKIEIEYYSTDELERLLEWFDIGESR